MERKIACAVCGKVAPPGLWGAGWIAITPAGMVMRRAPDGGVQLEPRGAMPRARAAVVCSQPCLLALDGRD